MMPVVVAGGVILAVSLLGATQTETGLVPNGPLLTYLNQLGKAGMAMMIPVFAAYISYSVAGKPGLTPGFILGYIANNAIMINGVEVKAGFLGALILGLLAGYMAKWMKGLKVGKTIRSIMPILVIPISTVLCTRPCLLFYNRISDFLSDAGAVRFDGDFERQWKSCAGSVYGVL